MNSTIKTLIAGMLLLTVVGCSTSQNLPSVRVGGGVNNGGKLLDLRVNESGLGMTLPLVSVDIPSPTVSLAKEE